MAAGWILELEESDSRLHKERVLEKALMASKLGSSDAQAFLFNCYQAYNPFYTFHVRQVAEVTGHAGRDNDWPKFWGLLESLRTRSVTGNAARQAIEACSQSFDDAEWNTVCRRVILKDLRCGISEKTINFSESIFFGRKRLSSSGEGMLKIILPLIMMCKLEATQHTMKSCHSSYISR